MRNITGPFGHSLGNGFNMSSQVCIPSFWRDKCIIVILVEQCSAENLNCHIFPEIDLLLEPWQALGWLSQHQLVGYNVPD